MTTLQQAQISFCCVILFAFTVNAFPQVWNIGFHPPRGQEVPLPQPSSTDAPLSTSSTSTTPSAAFYDCLNRCPATNEYNPICGSDDVNYHNLGKLQCATRCGLSVTMVRAGTCRPL